MIKAIIVDDEVKSRDILFTLLKRYCGIVSVEGTAANIEAALPLIKNINPEVVFLDISMPGGSAFDLLDQLGSPGFEIIFTTAHSEYAIPAIKAEALDYLLKPINIEELQHAVQKAEERIYEKRNQHNVQTLLQHLDRKQEHGGKIAAPVNDGLEFLLIDQITRLMAKGSYTQIYCADNSSILSSKPLKDYENLLPASLFFRVHHSHLINLSCIKHYHRGEGGYVTMNDGSVIDISKRKKREFLELFNLK